MDNNYGFAVANTFTLASSSTVSGANFTLWNISGDVTSQVDWSIVSDVVAGGSPNLSTTLASGTATVSGSFQYTNGDGYDISLDGIGFSGIGLAAGTYWFELQNAVASNSDPAFWDINGGLSSVWESADGYNPSNNDFPNGSESNSFQILGTAAVPEPASMTLLVSGVFGLSLIRRRRA